MMAADLFTRAKLSRLPKVLMDNFIPEAAVCDSRLAQKPLPKTRQRRRPGSAA